jgi:hypothetical protein
LVAGDATGWFDKLYVAAVHGQVTMPWGREHPHPLLVEWAQRARLTGTGRSAVVVGCALGADAGYVAGLGFDTVGFDVSPTAVDLARQRHPTPPSHTCARTCSTPPAAWRHAFDLVVEIITLQALPPDLHAQAGSAVRDFVAPDGTLLVIGAVPDDAVATGPWPLTRAEIEALATGGLQAISIEIRETPDAPIDLRWRAEFRRAGPGTCA